MHITRVRVLVCAGGCACVRERASVKARVSVRSFPNRPLYFEVLISKSVSLHPLS